jgi:hypothetical protein
VGGFVEPDCVVLRTTETVGFLTREYLNDVLIVLFLILRALARDEEALVGGFPNDLDPGIRKHFEQTRGAFHHVTADVLPSRANDGNVGELQ